MQEWWSNLGQLRQFFYLIAVPATIILVIQSILSVIGLGDFSGRDSLDMEDIDADGLAGDLPESMETGEHGDLLSDQGASADFKFFTIRGLVAFFAIFGWTGAALADGNPLGAVLSAVLAGLLAMFAIAYLFYAFSRLQSNGSIDYQNCMGKRADVYLTIPEDRNGKGKVTLTVQQRLIECDAMTDSHFALKTGESVLVTGVLTDHTLIVESK